MRHQANTKTFGRNPSHRRVLYHQLTTSLIEHGRIKTTLDKAKAIRGLVDQMITYAKEGSLHAKKQARKIIKNKTAFKRLFSDLQKEFRDLPNIGGYSRILKVGTRRGDNARMVLMELVNYIPKIKAQQEESVAESGASKKKFGKKSAAETSAKTASTEKTTKKTKKS